MKFGGLQRAQEGGSRRSFFSQPGQALGEHGPVREPGQGGIQRGAHRADAAAMGGESPRHIRLGKRDQQREVERRVPAFPSGESFPEVRRRSAQDREGRQSVSPDALDEEDGPAVAGKPRAAQLRRQAQRGVLHPRRSTKRSRCLPR